MKINVFDKPRAKPNLFELCRGEKTKRENSTFNRKFDLSGIFYTIHKWSIRVKQYNSSYNQFAAATCISNFCSVT